MKKAILLLAFTFLAESQNLQAQEILRNDPHGHNFIVSNMRDAGRWGTRDAGGAKNRRAASFYTGTDNYYGVTFRIRHVFLHYNEDIEKYGTKHAQHRWARPRIYADAPTGRSRVDTEGYVGKFDDNERRGFGNQNLVRMGGRITIHPNRTYWLIFDTGYAGQPLSHDGIIYSSFYRAKDTSEYSPSDWTIGDDEMYSNNEGTTYRWATPRPNSPPLQFALHVERRAPDAFEIGDTITPGNLGEANVSLSGNDRNRGINNWSWVATPFYTASRSGTPPHLFRLDHVTMLNNIRSYRRYNGGEHVIAIYDSVRDPDNWWRRFPGEEIGRFSSDLPEIIDGEFEGSISSDNNRQHRFHTESDSPILLKPWTRYWLVQKMEDWNSGDSAITDLGMPSFTRSKHSYGWSIGDYYFRTHNRGQNWLEVNEDQGAHNDWTMRFGFGATIVAPAQKGDTNFDGDIDVFDLILINDHLRGAHHLRGVLFDLGNINSDGGSQYITNSDRDLLLDLILEK